MRDSYFSNFSEGILPIEVYDTITSLIEDGKKVFLYHLPRPHEKQGQLSSLFFELLSNHNANACVFGMSLSVDCVCVLDSKLLLESQEELATIVSNKMFISATEGHNPKIEMAESLVVASESLEVKFIKDSDTLLEYLNEKKS